MRRKKDDKRVLRSGNGRQDTTSRMPFRRSKSNNFNSRPIIPRGRPRGQPRDQFGGRPIRKTRQKRKASKGLMLVMIIALVAFVIGAGIGVSLSFDDGTDEGPKYVNVTKEMTSNLNETQEVYFEKNVDDVDYNENVTSQYNLEFQHSEDN